MAYYHVQAQHSATRLFRFNLDAGEIEAQVVSHLRSGTSFIFQGRTVDPAVWIVQIWETPEKRLAQSFEDTPEELWLNLAIGGSEVMGELLYGTGQPVQTPGSQLAADPERAKRIFVSHAGADAAVAGDLVDLLRLGCNLGEEAIFYTSSAEYAPPSGADWARYIRERLATTGLLVVLISPAFLGSRYCLLELGAQWMTEMPWHPMLIPPATTADVNELPQRPQARRIDDAAALDELRDKVTTHLSAQTSTAGWNKNRDAFLGSISAAIAQAEADPQLGGSAGQGVAQRSVTRAHQAELIGLILNCEGELQRASEEIEIAASSGLLWPQYLAPGTEAWRDTEHLFRSDSDLQDCYLPLRAAYEAVDYLNSMTDIKAIPLGESPFVRATPKVAAALGGLAERRAAIAALRVED